MTLEQKSRYNWNYTEVTAEIDACMYLKLVRSNSTSFSLASGVQFHMLVVLFGSYNKADPDMSSWKMCISLQSWSVGNMSLECIADSKWRSWGAKCQTHISCQQRPLHVKRWLPSPGSASANPSAYPSAFTTRASMSFHHVSSSAAKPFQNANLHSKTITRWQISSWPDLWQVLV